MSRFGGLLARFTDLVSEVDQNGRLREAAAAKRAHRVSVADRALNAHVQAEGAAAVRDHLAGREDWAGARRADRLVKSKTARARTWEAREGHSRW